MKRSSDVLEQLDLKKARGCSSKQFASVVAPLINSLCSKYAVTNRQVTYQLEKRRRPLLECKVDLQLPLCDATKGVRKWPILSLSKLISHYVETSEAYRNALVKAVQSNPGPLSLILCEDEVIPNNIMRQKRKIHCWYASFKKFGLLNRSEHFWLPFAALFSKTAQQVEGGFSCVQKILIQSLLEDCPSVLVGMSINQVQPTLLRARVGHFLQDEAAMKSSWSVKGHAGIKPCLSCSNVVMKEHALVLSDNTLCDITETDVSKFRPLTNQEMWAMQDYLHEQSQVLTKGKLEILQTCSGQNHELKGLLACRALRAHVGPECSVWDPTHVYFSDGICTWEIDLLIHQLKGIGVTHTMVQDFCNSGWRCQGNCKVKLEFKKDGLRGGASSALTAIPLLRHFIIKVVPAGALVEVVESFKALADEVMCLQALKSQDFNCLRDDMIAALVSLQKKHFDLFKVAYGVLHVKPKHHYALHIPGQLKANKFFLDCFTPERKHRLLLADIAASHAINPHAPQANEIFSLASCNLAQLSEMQKLHLESCLVDPKDICGSVFGTVADAQVSAEVHLSQYFMSLKRGDVILTSGSALSVSACVCLDKQLHILAQRWSLVRLDGHANAQLWAKRDDGNMIILPIPAA